jgi:Group II intron, maturase-specific domain
LSRALRAIEAWCRRHHHTPVRWQREQLSSKLRGHYAYYGMTGNGRSMSSFRHHVERIWRKWLRRRSNAKLPWARFSALLAAASYRLDGRDGRCRRAKTCPTAPGPSRIESSQCVCARIDRMYGASFASNTADDAFLHVGSIADARATPMSRH